ncbi:MAG: acetamidase/formamidase family protein [Oscillospiraceae bacterium]|nr:acetamidase/formamidase family protein [Oscillospiraceae bacterium]
MKVAMRKMLTNTHGPLSKPQITVAAGEVFEVHTELCSGEWLLAPTDRWTQDKMYGCNPSVVVSVDSAEPGDILKVHILAVEPDALGYTGFTNHTNPLACLIKNIDWGLNERTVEIRDGFIHWDEQRKIPVIPMVGTLGTAPKSETLSNAKGGLHGGNMDVQEVRAGSIVYLPVAVPGALLHVGDCHAIQGDGEINCSGGIECRATVRLKVEILKGQKTLSCVRIEDDNYIMTVACQRSTEESFYEAAAGMLEWMTECFGFSDKEGYLLMGLLMEARATQFVNPTRTYICKMPKKYLK